MMNRILTYRYVLSILTYTIPSPIFIQASLEQYTIA